MFNYVISFNNHYIGSSSTSIIIMNLIAAKKSVCISLLLQSIYYIIALYMYCYVYWQEFYLYSCARSTAKIKVEPL